MIHPPFELPAIKIFYQNEQYDDCHVVVGDDKYIDKIITKHLTIVPASVFMLLRHTFKKIIIKPIFKNTKKNGLIKTFLVLFGRKQSLIL